MKINDAKPGDVVLTWHQSSERTADPIYARVLRVNRVTWTVQSEFGNVLRVRPSVFTEKSTGWHPASLALVNAGAA